MSIRFFKSAAAFREWLNQNHDRFSELWVGFHKKDSGKGGITYPEALDEALCFGWIDGVRKSINVSSYKIRFTPRRANGIWSLVNLKRAEELEQMGRMKPPGLKAFRARDPKRSGVYSFESAARQLDPAYEEKFQRNKRAWQFFKLQPPGYQRTVSFFVMSAKKEETRLRRLARLIKESEERRRLGIVAGTSKK